MNKGRVCVSIFARTVNELAAKVRLAEQDADIIELRLDCLPSSDRLPALETISSTSKLIVTLRPISEGGYAELSLDERKAVWSAAGNKFWTADLEEDIFDHVNTDQKKIISFHDHVGAPDDLAEIVSRLLATPADVIKAAVTANDVCDAIPVWKLLESRRDVIPIAMGEAGKWTRILGLAHGAFLTYASLDAGSGTAAGQLSLQDLNEVYRVKEITSNTGVYGVIGDPVSASLSPYIHNAAFSGAGIDSIFIPLELKDLDAFIARMVRQATREVELNFAGFAVTMPHKQAIIQHLDEIDPVAAAVGAVNTVKIMDGRLIGYNTDADGFIGPLKKRSADLKDVRVAVMGAGGAAKACAYALLQEGASVTVLARDVIKAANEFAHIPTAGMLPLAQVGDNTGLGSFDVIVNATPVGMGELAEETLFTADQLAGVKFVYDLVTLSGDTPLVAEAKKADVQTIGGIEMLIAQAERQFRIWTGLRAAPGVMLNAARSRMQ